QPLERIENRAWTGHHSGVDDDAGLAVADKGNRRRHGVGGHARVDVTVEEHVHLCRVLVHLPSPLTFAMNRSTAAPSRFQSRENRRRLVTFAPRLRPARRMLRSGSSDASNLTDL